MKHSHKHSLAGASLQFVPSIRLLEKSFYPVRLHTDYKSARVGDYAHQELAANLESLYNYI